MNSDSQVELAVDMRSPCCAKKIESALQDMAGIKSLNVDPARQTVVVEGDVVAETLKQAIEKKTGMSAVVMGLGSTLHKNLGSAVAAIVIGNSSVKGLMRMTQSDPETCIIEGSLDGLPDSNDLYVSLHDSGDLSEGCSSCGPLYGDDSSVKDIAGIISHLEPEKDKSAAFRCVKSNLKVSDMYGRCIVVHNGDQQQIKSNQSTRLACGIVARSSGVFENSKRFCACDGVTIWEEKKRKDKECCPSL